MSETKDSNSYNIGSSDDSIGIKLETMLREAIPSGVKVCSADWADWSGMLTLKCEEDGTATDDVMVSVPRELADMIMDVMVVSGIVMLFTHHIRGYVTVVPE